MNVTVEKIKKQFSAEIEVLLAKAVSATLLAVFDRSDKIEAEGPRTIWRRGNGSLVADRRFRRMTPALMKAHALQGAYLGKLRVLKGAARARVKKVAKEKGVAEAVKLAKALVR
jgi:hypothetical protein